MAFTKGALHGSESTPAPTLLQSKKAENVISDGTHGALTPRFPTPTEKGQT